MLKQAYSVFEIKAVDDDKRQITGMATTPEPDRMEDVVDPEGAQFDLPIPFLWQHDHKNPIGKVTRAKVSAKGIEVVVQLAKAGVSAEIDRAWALIKEGLVRGLSIGFRALKVKPIKDSFGVLFQEWDWLELSAVTIPANAEATITAVKSYDKAAIGLREIAGVSAPVVKLKQETAVKKTIAQQIEAFQALLKEKTDKMTEIMSVASEAGQTLDAAAQEEYDTLAGELKGVEEHIARLKTLERANLSAATAVKGTSAEEAAASRAPAIILPTPGVQVVRQKLAPGTAFTRMVGALAASRGNRAEAAMIAERWKDSTPEVLAVLRMPFDVIERAAVNPGTTTDSTWAEPLVQYNQMASEFIEFLRPLTVIGRIQGFRRVPFKIKVPRQTAGAAVNWVGEAKVKPLSSLAFDSLTLDHFKIAGIIPLSEELVRFSSPSAEELVRTDLAAAITQFMDTEFLDPNKALAAGVSPASITNGVTPVVATGTTAAAFRTDVRTLMANFFGSNINVASGVWIMKQGRALALSLMQNALGQPEFPGITPTGGTLLGFPVIVSENVPAQGGSPTDGDLIIFALAGEILLADDGAVSIDMSREASLQMDSTPDSPATASTVLVSLWQHNMVAIKAERFINWQKRRAQAVQFISSAKYAE